MKTSSAKAKGRRFQQLIAKLVSEYTKLSYGKDEMIASREMGQSGTDIRLIGEARKRFPFSVECKNCETWQINKWIEQAKSNIEKNTDWLLCVTKNRTAPIVIMDLDRWECVRGDADGLEITIDKEYRALPSLLKQVADAKKPKNTIGYRCTSEWTNEMTVLNFPTATNRVAVIPLITFFSILERNKSYVSG